MKRIKLDAPASSNTVRVRMIDTGTVMNLHSTSFIEPVVPGHETMNMPDLAFLIENERLGKRALFDLGVRKDYWNLPPTIQQRFDKLGYGMKVDHDVKDVLSEQNIPLESINDIIWSHTHWDHTGDTSLFPPTTNLVYGPGISALKPGYPTNPKSPLAESLFQNRTNVEISFTSSSSAQHQNNFVIGGFPAHDFYNDGSFYLLSTPGHAQGHMCGLARTTPDTFILMGGDVCHFPGAFRPNPAYPLPDFLSEGTLDLYSSSSSSRSLPCPCPASFFLDCHPQFHNHQDNDDDNNNKKESELSSSPSTTPFYNLSTAPNTAYDTPDPQTAQSTIQTLLTSFDGATNVFVILAHDPSLLFLAGLSIPTLNSNPRGDLNGWFEEGWKERCYWGWLGECVGGGGSDGGSSGSSNSNREMNVQQYKVVDGWWKGGGRWDTARELIEDVVKEGEEHKEKKKTNERDAGVELESPSGYEMV